MLQSEKINNELNCLTQKQNKRKKKTSRDKESRKKEEEGRLTALFYKPHVHMWQETELKR